MIPPPAEAMSAEAMSADAVPDDGYLRTPWTVLDDYQCFGCSPHNPHGLRLRFQERPDGLVTAFRLEARHESYPGVVHGGLLGVICDETMGNLIVLRAGRPAFTTAMRLRYLAPVPVGVAHECHARIIPGSSSTDTSSTAVSSADASRPGGAAAELLHTEADIVDGAGNIVATARATYRPVALEAARDRIRISDAAAGRLDRVLAAAGRLDRVLAATAVPVPLPAVPTAPVPTIPVAEES